MICTLFGLLVLAIAAYALPSSSDSSDNEGPGLAEWATTWIGILVGVFALVAFTGVVLVSTGTAKVFIEAPIKGVSALAKVIKAIGDAISKPIAELL